MPPNVSRSRVAGKSVSALDLRDAHFEAVVPRLPAAALRLLVLGVAFPGEDGRLVAPIAHGDADAVGAAGALDPEKAGVTAAEIDHPLRHDAVRLAIVRGAFRGEDHRVVRRLGRFRDTGGG